MTEKGSKLAEEAAAGPPSKWEAGDFVVRREMVGEEGMEEQVHANVLYRIVSVPLEHTDSTSVKDVVTLQWLRPIDDGDGDGDAMEKERGLWEYELRPELYGGTVGDATFTADTLAWVDSTVLTVTTGKLSNKATLTVELDLDAYYASHVRFLQGGGDGKAGGGDDGGDEGGGEDDDDESESDDEDAVAVKAASAATLAHNAIDKSILNDVLGRLPIFLSAKSKLVTITEDKGHILILSAKYHAEAAGQGIEYCFGRTKWWFKKHNRESTDALKELSAQAFTHDVVSVDHVRKFARKNRDYHRVYRAGVVGIEAEDAVKMCKSHRCALDTDYTFITEDLA